MLEDLKKNNKLKTILAIAVILVLYFFRGVLPGVHQTDQTQLSGDVRYPEFYKVVGKANISSQDKKLRAKWLGEQWKGQRKICQWKIL